LIVNNFADSESVASIPELPQPGSFYKNRLYIMTVDNVIYIMTVDNVIYIMTVDNDRNNDRNKHRVNLNHLITTTTATSSNTNLAVSLYLNK